MAAIMSTTSTLFVIAGFGLSRDLYQNLINNNVNEQQLMRVNRLSQFIIGLIVAAIAISRPAAIYWISIYAGALFGVGWLPSVIAGLEWKRMNYKAAIASMSLGVLSFIGITELEKLTIISLPQFLDPLMIAFLISLSALIIVALLTTTNQEEVDYFYQIKNTKSSTATIQEFLTRINGLSELKREYRSVLRIMATTLLLAFAIWGYLFIKLGT